MKKKLSITILLCFVCFCPNLLAQTLAVKNNLASDALASPNLSLELKLGNRITLDIAGHYNPISSKANTHRWKHWLLQPELRLWRCEPFSGHFWGVHLLTGEYNVANRKLPFGLYKGISSARYEGFVWGAGLSYGYQWVLSPRWGLEAEVGMGYVQASYDRYRCEHCGEKTASGQKSYLGPTKAALSIVYLLK